MADTFTLQRIVIDTSRGSPVVTFHGQGKSAESGDVFPSQRTLVPTGPALTRTNGVVSDALAYLSSQYGVTVTIPPIQMDPV